MPRTKRLEDEAAERDPELDERLRMQVPPVFVAATIAVAAMMMAAVAVHLSIGSFSSYRGVSLLQEQLVRSSLAAVPSSSRAMRIQGLAEANKEAKPEVIRFEADKKVGGGDLMVPVSMVDYENLGEGSIVDQRYPRKLPGADELEAEWNALWSGNLFSSEGADAGVDPRASKASVPRKLAPPSNDEDRLEGMGVNVNGYRKDPSP